MVPTTSHVIDAVDKQMGGDIAEGNAALVASNRQLAAAVARCAALPTTVRRDVACFLGGGFAAGMPRIKWSPRSMQRQRFRYIHARRHRFRRLRVAVGPRTRVLATTGIVPGAGYGIEIYGISDTELTTAQQLAACVETPSAGGRSLTRLRLVRADPTVSLAIASILRWACEVWDAVCGAQHATHPP